MCEAEREGGSLLPWPLASKENSWNYGPISCLQVGHLEPLHVEAVLCEKEVNLSVGFSLGLSSVKICPVFVVLLDPIVESG